MPAPDFHWGVARQALPMTVSRAGEPMVRC